MFQCIIRLNKLGTCLSPTSRLNIIDTCATVQNNVAISKIRDCCLCNLEGNNCDLRIGTRHQASDHQIKDCHYYATLLIFSRLSTEAYSLSNVSPLLEINSLPMTEYLLNNEDYSALLDSYAVSKMINTITCSNFDIMVILNIILW